MFSVQQLYRKIVREWIIIAVILLPCIGLVAAQPQWRLDQIIYDKLMPIVSPPVDSRILLVKIDDASLSALGRWPWPRDVHTKLLDKLAELEPQAVLYDVIFTEPDSRPEVDERLGAAMERIGTVVVPTVRAPRPTAEGQPYFIPPIPSVAAGARGIGHNYIAADADGVVRRLYLREGSAVSQLNQLTWQAYAATFPSYQQPVMPDICCMSNLGANWFGWNELYIPYSGANPRIGNVSVIDVLNDNVDADELQNKIILVGATASGLGNRYPLASSEGAIPGIVAHGNLLNSLLNQHLIKSMPTWLNVLISMGTVLIVLGLFLTLRLRHTFLVCLAFIFLRLVLSLSLLAMGWWSAPGASLIGIALAYMFWSWRRLNTVATYFGLELDRMAQELKSHVAPKAQPKPPFNGDELLRRALALEAMIRHVRGSRRFIAQSLDSLPLSVFVTDLDGQVLLANLSANTLQAKYGRGDRTLIGKNVFQVLQELEAPQTAARISHRNAWSDDERDFQRLPGQVLLTGSGRSFKVQLAPLDTEESEPTGWLVGLLEITVERLAEEQRDSMLRFLSHDLRAPQSAILALLAMQDRTEEPLSNDELHRQIEQQVRRTQSLTDDFMLLDAAKSKQQIFEEVLLAAVVMDAVDQAWPLAQHKNIRISQHFLDDEACVIDGVPELLTRAIFNLLENAIKYSGPGTAVHLQLSLEADEAVLTIRDEGQGISAEDLPYLFDEFRQFGKGNARGEGYGLGMAFVNSVIQRHEARIDCVSEPDVGTTFTLAFRIN